MLNKLLTLFKIPELRRKILFTLAMLAVYRMGFWVPLPVIDQGKLRENIQRIEQGQGGTMGQVMQVVALFSAARIGNATIFGLGIMPYISAAIIFELLASVYPPLEQLRKEGEAGRKKINEYTRYATVFICLGQSYFWVRGLGGGVFGESLIRPEYNSFYWHMVCTFTMTCGTVLLMWIGEQIDAYGIGNGISLLITAGIIARMPGAGQQLFKQASLELGADMGIEKLLLLATLFVCVVVWVVAITEGQRRIPIQSAKHVRGRRILGGQRQFLPLRVNQAGVMPIIFASSLLMFPWFLFGQLSRAFPNSTILAMLADIFGGGRGYIYNICYIILIYFFCYFWTAITFNPKDMADNLKDYGSFIPGYRPGKRTAAYLEQVMVRITYVGAAFLAIVAVIPTVIATSIGIPYLIASFYGGTGLLIIVSVELELLQQIDSHLIMRNYPGLLEVETKRRT